MYTLKLIISSGIRQYINLPVLPTYICGYFVVPENDAWRHKTLSSFECQCYSFHCYSMGHCLRRFISRIYSPQKYCWNISRTWILFRCNLCASHLQLGFSGNFHQSKKSKDMLRNLSVSLLKVAKVYPRYNGLENNGKRCNRYTGTNLCFTYDYMPG